MRLQQQPVEQQRCQLQAHGAAVDQRLAQQPAHCPVGGLQLRAAAEGAVEPPRAGAAQVHKQRRLHIHRNISREVAAVNCANVNSMHVCMLTVHQKKQYACKHTRTLLVPTVDSFV